MITTTLRKLTYAQNNSVYLDDYCSKFAAQFRGLKLQLSHRKSISEELVTESEELLTDLSTLVVIVCQR